MSRETRSFAVIGLGAFGTAVAMELTRFGNQVVGVDIDERRVSQLSDTLTSTTIVDTTDEAALREAGLDRYDVAQIAIGRDIQASILSTMNLKMLGIDTIWAGCQPGAGRNAVAIVVNWVETTMNRWSIAVEAINAKQTHRDATPKLGAFDCPNESCYGIWSIWRISL